MLLAFVVLLSLVTACPQSNDGSIGVTCRRNSLGEGSYLWSRTSVVSTSSGADLKVQMCALVRIVNHNHRKISPKSNVGCLFCWAANTLAPFPPDVHNPALSLIFLPLTAPRGLDCAHPRAPRFHHECSQIGSRIERPPQGKCKWRLPDRLYRSWGYVSYLSSPSLSKLAAVGALNERLPSVCK